MRIDELRQGLDALFSMAEWERDPSMSRWVPRAYQAVGYDYTQILEPDFCARFNGFLHHPIDMEVAGIGFLPIPPKALVQMKTRGISVYACHAPLDCHDEIGTNVSIVQAFQVQVEQSFARYGRGFAGRIGSIAPLGLDELIAKGKEVFGIDRVEVGGAEPAAIGRVAIVAGGGDDVELFQEAEALGARAYISGEWYTRTTPAEESERRWAETNRAACQAYAASSGMALLGFSHAATEFLVMRSQMAGYFRRRGLLVECLKQSDWWR
jgi:hypothetical protein